MRHFRIWTANPTMHVNRPTAMQASLRTSWTIGKSSANLFSAPTAVTAAPVAVVSTG